MFKLGVDSTELEAADKKVDAFAKRLETAAKSFAALFAASKLAQFTEGLIDVGTQLGATAERLGVSTEALQAFHLGADELGIGAEQADTALQFLNKALGKAEEGSKTASAALARLGVNATTASKMPLPDLLAKVADGFVKLPDQAAKTATATELFGRAGTRLIPLLDQGSAGVAELTAEFAALGKGFSDDFVKKASDANKAAAKFRVTVNGLKSSIGSALLPVVTRMIDKVRGWSVAFKEYIDKTDGVRSALLFLTGGTVLAAVSKLWSVLGLGRQSLGSLLSMFARFAIPVAIIGALYLIFDDLYTLMQGGNSYFGQLLDNLGGLGSKEVFVQQVTAAVEALKVVGADLWKTLQQVGAAFGVAFADGLPGAIQLVIDLVRVLSAGLSTIAAGLGQVAQLTMALGDVATGDTDGAGKHVDASNKIGADWWKSMDALFPKDDDGKAAYAKWAAANNSPQGQEAQMHMMGIAGPGGYTPAPRAAGPTTTYNQQRTTVENHFTVDGSKDPKATADAVSKKVTASMQSSDNQYANAAVMGWEEPAEGI